MRYPLIDGQGNFGSPGNDPPAAMRYTECRLTPLAMEILSGIDEETVDFQANYDGRTQEPLVLPSRVPNLLINGSAGIAVGIATLLVVLGDALARSSISASGETGALRLAVYDVLTDGLDHWKIGGAAVAVGLVALGAAFSALGREGARVPRA